MEPINLLETENPALTEVSPRLATVRRIGLAIFTLVPAVASLVVALIFSPWGYLGVAVFAASYIIGWWIIGRQVRAHRYLEGDEDFFVAHGRWWRSVTVVPYGRIQFIDVDEGPLSRLFGLATLKLNTASASSDARLSGLPRAEALAIRQRLSDKARERMAGL